MCVFVSLLGHGILVKNCTIDMNLVGSKPAGNANDTTWTLAQALNPWNVKSIILPTQAKDTPICEVNYTTDL